MKTRIALVSAVLLLALTGCAGTAEQPTSDAQDAAPSVETPAPETPEPESQKVGAANGVDITAPGEVCDPQNANDPICAVFYPDQSVLNRTSPERSREPLTSLSDEEKIALAHQACENMKAGNRAHLIDTIPIEGDPEQMADRNNISLYSIGAMSYCHEFIEPSGFDDQPDRNIRIMKFYGAMTEEEAKAHFADKIMPTKEELGY